MKIEIFVCVLLLAGVSVHGAAVPDEKSNEVPGVSRQMTVFAESGEVLSIYEYGTTLNCDYSISTGEDLPVTINWFRGPSLVDETKVFSCDSFQKSTNTCANQQIHDAAFAGRMWLGSGTPSLIVAPVGYYDNDNFWCQVSLEGNELAQNGEIGVDAKSVVMRVRYGSSEIPKLNTIYVSDENIVTSVGDTVTLYCNCSGSYCWDAYWYKGPFNIEDNEYEMVYERVSGRGSVGPGYEREQALNRWIGRATLDGYSLTISNVESNDAGRYWCEVQAPGVSNTASDAKSMVLEVGPFTCMGKNGLYPNPDDCSSYFQCYNGQTYQQSCAAGTVFNPDPNAIFVCDVPSNVAPPCGTKVN